jgi:hypothetical protein
LKRKGSPRGLLFFDLNLTFTERSAKSHVRCSAYAAGKT